ncbi:MAG: ChbG/HpnK family deacetylase [Alphaproteobacteria bacterium]|nr:ChbG/HpnK family deacetylase [Alphaproteobacteria bacterium]
MVIKRIFNADDFGISLGVNAAIEKAYTEGILNSASVMVNQKYALQAVEAAKKMPKLETGLHLNLTNEYPAANPQDIPLLVNAEGKLKNGFLMLLINSFLHPKKFAEQTETEIRAQLKKYADFGLPLRHIDGHRHVHLIPAVFKIVKKVADEYQIPRIRTMNENIFNTLKFNSDKSFLFDGGLIKYFLLRFFTWWNGYKSDVYFYTILYTCKITKDRFCNVKIPTGYNAVEIMIHPGMPDIDKKHPEDVWDDNILSPYRTKELETLLDKTIPERIN